VNGVAYLLRDVSDLPCDRSCNHRVTQLQLDVVQRGLVLLDDCRGAIVVGFELHVIVGRDVVLFEQRLAVSFLRGGTGEESFVARQRGLGHSQLQFVRRAIDLHQRLAG
jgi:hypothetical protein